MDKLKNKKLEKERGITLIVLVITIIVLLILAGVTISALTGEDGIIFKAQNASKTAKLSQIQEQIQIELLDCQLEYEATGADGITNERLKEIIEKYGGTLDEDGDTIRFPEGELSLKELIEGNIKIGSGLTPEEKGQIAELEEKIKKLNTELNELKGKLETLQQERDAKIGEIEEKEKEITELTEQLESKTSELESINEHVNNLIAQVSSLKTQIEDLQKKQASGTAVASNVLKGKTFSNSEGVGIEGTMEDRGNLTWNEINVETNLEAGYYSGGTISSTSSYNKGYVDGQNNVTMKTKRFETNLGKSR